jgi:hypothetical protein
MNRLALIAKRFRLDFILATLAYLTIWAFLAWSLFAGWR